MAPNEIGAILVSKPACSGKKKYSFILTLEGCCLNKKASHNHSDFFKNLVRAGK
jgi:hypothetical protein